jgi:hypothetical protein
VISGVTASQIIDEIKRLAPEEQAGVVRFVYELDAERKLSGPELSMAMFMFWLTAAKTGEC